MARWKELASAGGGISFTTDDSFHALAAASILGGSQQHHLPMRKNLKNVWNWASYHAKLRLGMVVLAPRTSRTCVDFGWYVRPLQTTASVGRGSYETVGLLSKVDDL